MKFRMTETEVKRLWRNRGVPPSEMIRIIAELNGCSYSMARDECESIGVIGEGEYVKRESKKSKWKDEETEELVRLWHEGLSITEIAKRLNRAKGTVWVKINHMLQDKSMYQV